MLSPESSAEPGQWRTDRAPYQREMMDVVNDPSVETVTIIKAAQVGATEVLNNIVGFHIHQDPAPILMVQPTKEMGEAYSKDRFAPMLRDSSVLRNKVSDVKSRSRANTLLHKKFPGGHITIGGANSPAGLASRPIRIVLCDEVDRYPASAGTEGDPISLAEKRTTTFWNRKIVNTSTPTVDGVSRIQRSYMESDQRRFWVACPHCERTHLLTWANIVWEKDETRTKETHEYGRHLPETAAHVCPHCGGLETDAHLYGMLQTGQWIPKRPEVKHHRGYHINELYSPWVRFGDTVRSFLKAKNDPDMLKTWTNTALGECWSEGEDIGSANVLVERCENYDGDLVPFGGVVITIGVDVQDDRLELETIAWGMDHECWSLEYNVLYGDTSLAAVWTQLDNYRSKIYQHESGKNLRVMSCGIDTGGHSTEQVYAYCKPRFGQHVFALKGMGGQGKALVSRPSKNNMGKVNLYTVGTDTAKDAIASYLSQEKPGPGYCHFPRHYSEAYFDMLLAERPTIKYTRGRRTRSWQLKKPGIRNEALDCRVYGLAALKILGIDLNQVVSRFMAAVGANPAVTSHANTPAPEQRPRRRMRSEGYGRDYSRAG